MPNINPILLNIMYIQLNIFVLKKKIIIKH